MLMLARVALPLLALASPSPGTDIVTHRPATAHAAALRLADDRADVVRVVTDAYIDGVHAKPSSAAMRAGFHPDFRMLVLTNGAMSAVTRDEWIARLEKADPSAPRPRITSDLAVLDLTGTAASVRVKIFRDGVHTFTDHLLLYKFADGWKIVSKSFYAHPR